MKKAVTKKEVANTTEVAVAIPKQPDRSLVLEGDPEAQLAFAQKAAMALMKVVGQKQKKVMINGKQYLEFGDWQTLARFFGATVGIEWAKRLEEGGKYCGYEARAVVYQHGDTISSAEASCLTTEWNWGGNPKKKVDEYAVKSMAQTRASAKALRNAYGWVAELAGYASTPAEEMPSDLRQEVTTPSIPEELRKRISDTTNIEDLKEIWEANKGLGKEFANLVTEQKQFILSVKESEIEA